MSVVHKSVDYDDPVFVHPLGANSMGPFTQGQITTITGSGTLAANRIFFAPFFLNKPYLVSRFFWNNGGVAADLLSVGIYDEQFSLVKAGPQIAQAGTSAVQFTQSGIHCTRILNETSIADSTSYATASVTLKAGKLYLITVVNGHASDAAAISSVDNGPTFTSRSTTQFSASTLRQSIWSAVPSNDYTGTLLINFGAATQTGCIWAIHELSGVDTASNDGIVQQAVNSGNGTTISATLSAFGSANNGTFLGAGTTASDNGVPAASIAEMSDQNANFGVPGVVAGRTYWRSDNDTTPTHTVGTARDFGACAVEVKGFTPAPFWLPADHYYKALWISGATGTTPQMNATYGSYVQSTQFGFPQVATPVGGINNTPVFGFTRRSTP